MKRLALVIACFMAAVSVAAGAQEKRYQGNITAVDTKTHTFTVKGTEKGETAEMKFHVDKTSAISIDGERKIFGELAKGDHVEVTYGSSGTTHTVMHVDRHMTAMQGSAKREMPFDGEIIDVDTTAHTFTAKRTLGGKVEEMMFHVKPGTRIYVGGEQMSLVQQLRKGDEVTVHYETASGEHLVKAVGKTRKAS